ncbi:MAG: acyl-CoA thioester hydrolase [Cellvibrionaceae bacterium]|jgi:acyl-CoA thioester hydrolase
MTLETIYSTTVQPDWLDMNDHMNEGYYGLAFGFAIDKMFIDWGLEAYLKETGCTFYSAETHIVYVQELVKGDPIHFTAQIVGMGPKKIQIVCKMIHSEKGYLAATAETMHLHYDQVASKVSPILESFYTQILDLAKAQAHLPVPDQAGRAVKQLRRVEIRE